MVNADWDVAQSAGALGDDGLIYLFGGTEPGESISDRSEVFDPITHSLTPLASLPTARYGHSAARGSDGRIYVIGGTGGGAPEPAMATVEAYDPQSGTWSSVTPMSVPRAFFSATAGPDGRIYVFGGNVDGDQSIAFDTGEVYNPATDSWAPIAAMPAGRDYHDSALGPDGKIYVTGGRSGGGSGTQNDDVFVYDPVSDSWSSGPSLLSTRWRHSSASTAGRLYVIAGEAASVTTDSVESVPFPGWQTEAPLNTARIEPLAVAANDGLIYLFGGFAAFPESDIQALDPVAGTWTMVNADWDVAQSAGALGDDGLIYLFGGTEPGESISDRSEVFDPITHSLTPLASLPTARYGHSAARGSDGRIYVIGGTGGGAPEPAMATVEAYDPQSGTWSSVTPMSVPRAFFSATAGPDGRIYVFGGNVDGDQSIAFSSGEVYNPATDSWTPIAVMPAGRDYHDSALGPDGKIYITGGRSGAGTGSQHDDMFVYDPASDSWASGPSLLSTRWRHSSASAAGRLFVIAGEAASVTTDSVESYGPFFGSPSISLDSDGDGIPNSVDACPSVAEDFDGVADDDGCPEVDEVTCEPGYYSISGYEPCFAAPPGSYVPVQGATSPILCEPGTFQPDSAASLCLDALPGGFVAGEGETEMEFCSPGGYQPEHFATSCLPAPAGSYVDVYAAETYQLCPVGMYQPNEGSVECIASPPGSFVPIEGAIDFSLCAFGTFQPDEAGIECFLAPAGSFVAAEGAIEAQMCPVGTYQPNEGSTTCIASPAGAFVDFEGALEPTLCPAGRYQPGESATKCLPAPAGSFVSSPGAIAATRCPAGTYQAYIAALSCFDAPAGTSVGFEGAIAPTACSAGYYQPATAQTTCIPAAIGFYVATPGAASQTTCPAGYTTATTGSVSLAQCFRADSDGDGVPDSLDAFPFDPLEWIDTDGDHIGNNNDHDDDNDGFPDLQELIQGSNPLSAASTPETCDGLDNDLDLSTDEGFPDSDLDGQRDCIDPDDDGDGVADNIDYQPTPPGAPPIPASLNPGNNSFSDLHLGGRTVGVILNPNGNTISVTDELPNPDRGVRFTVTPGFAPVIVQLLSKPSFWELRGGVSMLDPEMTTTVDVEPGGSAEAVFLLDGVEVRIGVEGGSSVTITETVDEDGVLTNLAIDKVVGEVIVNGEPVTGPDPSAFDADDDGVIDPQDSCPLLPGPAGTGGCPEACTVTPTTVGTNGNDTIYGTPGDDVIWAQDGNDTVFGMGGTDIICAGKGNDKVYTGDGNDVIDGGEGNDKVNAGGGNNVIAAGAGNDAVETGSGNDFIKSGEGNDKVEAGDGSNTIDSGAGNDDVTSGNGRDAITTEDGNDKVDAGGGENSIDTGAGNDDVNSGNGNDVIVTGDGNDNVDAGGGDDAISTGAGDDNVNGAAGFDTCNTGSGNNTVINCEA